MLVTYTSSVRDYLDKVEALLLRKEACNNLMLGILDRLLTHKADCHLGFVEKDGQIVYAFMQTPPNNWILADADLVNEDILKAVAVFLHEQNMDVPGVLGPDGSVEIFVEKWKELTHANVSIHMKQLIYQLDEVQIKPSADGNLIHAAEKDLPLIANWLYQFGQEANENIDRSQAEQMAANFIKNQSLHLWEANSEIVSMANTSRKTKHGASINAVFTPDQFKKKGYATNAVAALSQKLLDQGFQFCSLYTDRENPTSNGIYKRIGYYEVGISIVYNF
ncbi:hypothetical protein CIL03_18590 [Virgibacillus indicus]|uniref:N-acetyltransferase domain-containing protein n=1 Tax=Virgibacillus indicus TaxID=2024554 RepID=A0A265N6Y6_9BACI|nr:GNAT family N-acetyltransferase [Virgibacillus indicus]OZU87106.1 hypothetical protein CIL03_18590 [Virgibacillus indicus]